MKSATSFACAVRAKLRQRVPLACLVCVSIFLSISAIAAPALDTSKPSSPDSSRSGSHAASPPKSHQRASQAIDNSKKEDLSGFSESIDKQAEFRLALASGILQIVALIGIGGGLAIPAFVKSQLLKDVQLKNIVSERVRAELDIQSQSYDKLIKIFKAHIDIGLAFSDGETPSDSELMRLLSTLEIHFKEPSESLGTEEIGASLGKLTDVAFKGGRSYVLSRISTVVREWTVANPLAARRLMEHHGSEILRGIDNQDSANGFRYFCDQCLILGLGHLAHAWQLVLYDKRYPAMFREELAVVLAKPKSTRLGISSSILEQSKSFHADVVREEFEGALGADWFSRLCDV